MTRISFVFGIALASFLCESPIQAGEESTLTKQAVDDMLKIGVQNGPQSVKPQNGASNLPKILLIGDSISGGYLGPVTTLLKGKAIVTRGENGGPSTAGLVSLDKVLGDKTWNIIHFNWGLHDMTWQFKMTQEDRGIKQYAARLEQLVLRLKKTGATLIWATTTPWCPETYGYVKQRYKKELRFSAEEEKQWKEAALAVMKKHNIPINDLHALLLPKLNDYLNKPDDIHFNRKGNEAMGRQIADVFAEYLQQAPDQGGQQERSKSESANRTGNTAVQQPPPGDVLKAAPEE